MNARFGGAAPILSVRDMAVSVAYYTKVLGFANADWGGDSFTCVTRDGASIYLCRDGQGHPGTWAYIGVSDVDALHAEYAARGARLRGGVRNYPFAREILVEDPDGNVLRCGSDPLPGRPFSDEPVDRDAR